MTAASQPLAAQPPMSMPDPGADHQRVMIVDASAVARAVLGRLVDAGDGRAVVRAVAGVDAALAYLATAPVEIILLAIDGPAFGAIDALPRLHAAAPVAQVVVLCSSLEAAVEAMALGAAAAVTRAGPSGYRGDFGADLTDTLDRLASGAAPPPVRPTPPRPIVVAVPERRSAAAEFDMVAIGASTGGIHALSGVLGKLPAGCRTPIVVTQHLPPSFMPFFAAQLALIARRPCDVAGDGVRVRPGRILVAPGDAHLRAVALADGGTALRLSRAPQPSGCMPSVDPMFSSLAAVHGTRLLAIVLSGMGRDGVIGAAAVRRGGGAIVVQDCASSVVWGMPGAIAADDPTATVLPPEAIGALIASGRRPR